MIVDLERVQNSLNGMPLLNNTKIPFVLNPLTEQEPYTDAALLKSACQLLAKKVNKKKTTKLLTEEDKGAIFVAGVSWLMNLPFGMARGYPNGKPGQLKQTFLMEYTKGTLYLSGIQKGDNVTIIEDMISTGGTLIALIQLVKKAKANVVDAICLVEKIGPQGVKNVYRKTGVRVKTLIKVSTHGNVSKVVK